MRSDAAALMRAARKDPAAFQELYERYAARIYAFGPAVNASQDLTRANRSVCFI
jgi:hypothetical protein